MGWRTEHGAFREAYAAANLSLADGQPLVWASRLLAAPPDLAKSLRL